MFGNTGPCLLASLVLGPLALAQESAAIFDAPNVVLTQFMVSNPPFDRLLDIDGDNRMDAVGMSVWDDYDHTYLRIYQNDGAGKLSSIWSTIVTRPGVADAQPLAVGDFSGDGRADFAVGIGNAIHLFQVHGPAAPVATEIAELVIPGGGALVDLLLQDLDGDSRADVCALATSAVPGQDVLYVYLSSSAAWNSVHPVDQALLLSGRSGLLSAEVNGSAPLDLVAVGDNSIDVLPVGSTGVVQYGMLVPLLYPAGSGTMVASGDIDGDGDSDVVAFGGSTWMGKYQVIAQQGIGNFVAGPLRVGGPATDLADVDADGDLDGVCCGGGGGPYPPLNNVLSNFEIAKNDGNGKFADAFQIPSIGAQHIAGVSDLDGDGDVDLVGGRCIYFSRGGVQAPPVAVSNTQPIGAGSWIGQLVQCDLDRDGDLDANPDIEYSRRNNGAGKLDWQARQVLNVPPMLFVSTSRPGDWDGDGDVDFVVSYYYAPGQTRHELVWNTGGGAYTWGDKAVPSGPDFQPGIPYLTRPVDLDLDGDLDMLETTEFAAGLSSGSSFTLVWMNDGTGHFAQGGTFAQTVKALADFDADGRQDLVIAEPSRLGYRWNAGQGQFAPPYWFNGPVLSSSSYQHLRVSTVDIDGDLDLDIAFGAVPGVQWIRNDFSTQPGIFTVITTPLASVSVNPVSVFARDYDLDGDADLLFTEGTSAVARMLIGNGGGTFTPGVDQRMSVLWVGDLDGDGDDDAANGAQTFFNARLHGPTAGSLVQSGAGVAGTGGLTPILGASGPFRTGELVTCGATGAVGGSLGFIAIAGSGAELVNIPFPGITLYVNIADPALLLMKFPPQGAPGAPGEGGYSFAVTIPSSMAGVTLYHQGAFLDPGAPYGLSTTQLLKIQYGI